MSEKSSRCRLFSLSTKYPAAGRNKLVPIWKKVIARPASISLPWKESIIQSGKVVTKIYWVISWKKFVLPIDKNGPVHSFSFAIIIVPFEALFADTLSL